MNGIDEYDKILGRKGQWEVYCYQMDGKRVVCLAEHWVG